MGKKGGGGEAAQARADEQERQDRIRKGTARVNSIFDGQTIGAGKLDGSAVFDPNAKYYLSDGSVWSPTVQAAPAASPMKGVAEQLTSGGRSYGREYTTPQDVARGRLGSNSTVATAKTPQEQFAEMLSGGKLFSGTERTSGFNDDYFAKQRQNYIDYATPQLEDQFGNANKELTFALSRSGLTNSSVRAQKEAELQKQYDLNKQQIADQALSYEGQARSSVEDARSNLIATLNATGDAEGAANSAVARASALSKPAAYSPLTNLFADFTSALGTQAALEKANYYSGGQTGVRYKTGLFGNSGAVKVT